MLDGSLVHFVKDGVLLADSKDARKIKCQATGYIFYENKLYKRSFSLLLLRCLHPSEGKYALRKIHEEICGNHLSGKSLAYNPNLKRSDDQARFIKKFSQLYTVHVDGSSNSIVSKLGY